MTDTAQATATVTLTLDDDEATAVLDALSHMAEAYDLNVEHFWMDLYQNVGHQIVTATAPPPAPSELEQAIAECEAKGLKPSLDQEFAIEGRPSWRALVRFTPNEGIGAFGFTPSEALCKAIANYERGAK